MMAWVVDTCLLIDVAVADPTFGNASARLLDARQAAGLTICPVTFIELAPVFGGDRAAEENFLSNVGVAWPRQWTLADSHQAHAGWARYVQQKRQRAVGKRPIADILIGAFALRHGGLLTRNGADFHVHFPELVLGEP